MSHNMLLSQPIQCPVSPPPSLDNRLPKTPPTFNITCHITSFHIAADQGALVALTQACTSLLPELRAAADVPAHQGASTAQSHISVSRWPPIAAARHTEASQGAGGCCALSHCMREATQEMCRSRYSSMSTHVERSMTYSTVEIGWICCAGPHCRQQA
jgi:hypothetical protein